MAYPQEVDKFTEKLNKLDNNTYVIEEEVQVTDGVYEGELQHDNVSLSSINVYTGSKLTGQKIENVIVSTPSLTPWKKTIKIFSDVSSVYISYQTTGDTVEAEDINRVQDSIVNTQIALNAEKDRAIDREDTIEDNLDSEISRAKQAENTLTNNLNIEINRAKNRENDIEDDLNSEINRATQSENNINTAITGEINRAKNAEQNLTDNLNSEIQRATGADETLTESLSSEINRAKQAENAISNTINTNKPNWDDKYTKNEIDNKISQVITDLDWKEAVSTYADIATTYPSPEDGWTVNVKDTDITYRYSGTGWVAISANSIPLATSSVDGKMSKQDKINLDDTNSKKHTHNNLSILQTITQALIDTWNDAYTHISDVVKHITSTERTLWNTVSNKVDKYIVVPAGTDLNTVVTSGFYRLSSTTANFTNIPPNIDISYGQLIVSRGLDTAYQIITGYSNNEFYMRHGSKGGGTDTNFINWQPWRRVWHDGNFNPTIKADKTDVYIKTDADNKFATKEEVSNAGYGDMLKSVYDTNGNGIVDKAEDSNTVGGRSASDFASQFTLPAIGNTATYFKIAELTTNVGSGENGGMFYINGTGSFGNAQMGFDIIQFSTRVLSYLRVFRVLNPGNGIIRYGYIVNSSTGKTEIWIQVPAYNYGITVYVANNRALKAFGNLLSQTTPPENIIWVDPTSDFMAKGPLTWNDLKGV